MLSDIQIQTFINQILLRMTDPSDEEPSSTEHTSTKLRMAIPRALAYFGRPISVHEFQSWIASNDRELSHEVSLKCYDYVRMILSLTKPQFLVKYKCEIAPPGNDKRAAFYGIPDGLYGSNWKMINPPRKKSRKTKRRFAQKRSRMEKPKPLHTPSAAQDDPVPMVIEEDESDLFFFPAEHTTLMQNSNQYVNDDMVLQCWKKLSKNYEFGDQIWSQLLRALSTAKERSNEAQSPQEIAKDIASQYSAIRDSDVIDQILMIIQREIIINREIVSNLL